LSLTGIIILLVRKSKTVAFTEEKNIPVENSPLVFRKEKIKGTVYFFKPFKKIGNWIKSGIFLRKNRVSEWKKTWPKKEAAKEKNYSLLINERVKRSEAIGSRDFFSKREIRDNENQKFEPEIARKNHDRKDIFEKIMVERIAANPKDVEAYERLGEYYIEIESWEYAKECFKQVIKLNPENNNAKDKMRELERVFSK
jgi:tetratricopeptide (TPR) repeat protein